MKEFTLKPMTEFVLDEYKLFSDNENQLYEVGKSTVSYAKFLSRPLEFWMFVPCDEIGEPMNYGEIKRSVIDGTDSWDAYQQAKDRVLFDGFSIEDEQWFIYRDRNIREIIAYCSMSSFGHLKNMNVESIVWTRAKLTEAGIKEAWI